MEVEQQKELDFPLPEGNIAEFMQCVNNPIGEQLDCFLRINRIENDRIYTEYFDGKRIEKSEDYGLLYTCLNILHLIYANGQQARSSVFLYDSEAHASASPEIKIVRCLTDSAFVDPVVLTGISRSATEKSDVYHLGCVFLGKPAEISPLREIAEHNPENNLLLNMTSIFPICRPTIVQALTGEKMPINDAIIASRVLTSLDFLQENKYIPVKQDYTLYDLGQINFDQLLNTAKDRNDRQATDKIRMIMDCLEIPYEILNSANTLQKLLELFPEKAWDWRDVSANPNITQEYIRAHIQFPWQPDVCENPNVTWEFLTEFPELIDYSLLSLNPNITADFVRANPGSPGVASLTWDWIALAERMPFDLIQEKLGQMNAPNQIQSIINILCKNPLLTLQNVKDNPNYNWFWTGLSMNKNVATWENVRTNPDLPWNWAHITERMPIQIIQKNLESKDPLPWSTSGLIRNPGLTVEFINAHPEYDFNDFDIDKNPGITWEFIIAHPEYDWDYRCLSSNPNITLEIVLANFNKNWNWPRLSENKTVATWENVRNNPMLNWNWNILSANPDIATREHVREYPASPHFSEVPMQTEDGGYTFPWNWTQMSQNPGLKWQTVAENADRRWDWRSRLSRNLFDYKEREKQDKMYALLSAMDF